MGDKLAPATPTPADRRLYGDLVDDVYLLRSHGRLVARFKGQFRVDAEMVDAADVRRMATAARSRNTMPTPTRPTTSAHALVCKKCGGPRTKGSGSFCRPCYAGLGKWPKSTGEAATVASRESKPAPDKLRPKTCDKCGAERTDDLSICSFCRDAIAEEARAAETAQPIAEPTPPIAETPDKFVRLADELRSGATIRQAARAAGVSTATAHAHAAKLTPPEFLCGCGKPNSHNGRCDARMAPKADSLAARVDALEAENATLKAAISDIRAHLAMEQGR